MIESGNQRFHLQGGQSQLQTLAQAAVRLRFLLIKPDATLLRLDTLESHLLNARVAGRLLRMNVNGQGCPGYVLQGDILHGLHYWQGSAVDEILKPYLEDDGYILHQHGRAFSVLLAPNTWKRQAAAELSFLYDGLLYHVSVPSVFCYNALIHWPELQLDLSRANLVKGPAYNQVVEAVQAMAMNVMEEFVENYPDLRPAHRELSLPLLISLQAHWNERGDNARGQLCRQWLERYHRTGVWLERGDSAKLVKELLQRLPEPYTEAVLRPVHEPEVTFWSWIFGWLTGPETTSPVDSGLDRLRESMVLKNRWREMLTSLLAIFDPGSSYRLGFAADSPDPNWLIAEGVLPDGSHLLLTGEGRNLSFCFYYPGHWPRRRQTSDLEAPPGWTRKATAGADWKVTFESTVQAWKDPQQLLALIDCVLTSRRQAQSEEVLPCPQCAQSMEKLVLDIVLDRCPTCSGLWLDYAEFEWLAKIDPGRDFLPPPPGGQCPRCRQPLRETRRNHKATAACPQCRGTWFLTRH